MQLSDFNISASVRIKQLTDLLEQMYGIQIDWDCPISYLETVLEHYQDRKQMVLQEHHSSPEYTKSVLITEAIRIYLKEIAPKRIKNSRRPK